MKVGEEMSKHKNEEGYLKLIKFLRIIATIIALIILIKYSSIPLPKTLHFTGELLIKPNDLDGIVVGVACSYIASEIFAFIVVFLPKKREEKYAKELINRKIINIKNYRDFMLKQFISAGKLTLDEKKLKKEDFKIIEKVTCLHEIESGKINESNPIRKICYCDYIYNSIGIIQDEINNIFLFGMLLDSKLMCQLDNILHSDFMLFKNRFKYNGSEIYLNGLGDTIYDFYKKIEELDIE